MGRPRKYANDKIKWKMNKRAQGHPPLRHLPVPPTPGFYVEHLEDLLATGQRFGCIYTDPPWPYTDDPPMVAATNHYALMTVEAICALPVRDLVADQAHLHLWTVNAFLFESQQILDAWGFT